VLEPLTYKLIYPPVVSCLPCRVAGNPTWRFYTFDGAES